MAHADEAACLRDLLPITDKGAYQISRKGFERPFVVDSKYIVFPEVKSGKLTGFYVYTPKAARYYDAVQSVSKKSAPKTPVAALKPGQIYNLTAQPEGLETLSILYEPNAKKSSPHTTRGAALGATMLPVVGALLELQEPQVRRDPAFTQVEIVKDQKDQKLVKMATSQPKTRELLMLPLKEELNIRKTWIKHANLDNTSFRNLNKILDTSCSSL